jgi:hypothetical protein
VTAGDVVPVEKNDFMAGRIWQGKAIVRLALALALALAPARRVAREAGFAGRVTRARGLDWLKPPTAEEVIALLSASNQLDPAGMPLGVLGIALRHFLAKQPPIKTGAAGIKTTKKIEPSLEAKGRISSGSPRPTQSRRGKLARGGMVF